MGYYEVHCIECGKITPANKLAFNFEKLIHRSIEKQMNRKLARKDKWKDLLKFTFKIYLTLDYLKENFNNDYTKSRMLFEFKVKDLKKHVELLSGYNFNQIVDEKNVENSNIYKDLISKISTNNKDQDAKELALEIQEFFDLLFDTDDEEIIAFFNLRIILSKDDKNQEFANMLEAEYEDGKIDFVIETVCPSCGQTFYTEIGKYKEIVIGMAGTARVGKTAYLAALVYSILEKNDSFISILPTDDPNYRIFRDNILSDYSKCQKIKKTEYETNIDAIPLFSLAIFVAGKGYIFTFVDMPGETFDDTDTSERGSSFIDKYRRIIKRTKIIWCCIDPRQIGIDNEVVSSDNINVDIDKIMPNMKRTISSINTEGNMDAAILITKSDTIEDKNEDIYKKDFNVFKEYIKDDSFINFDMIDNSGTKTGMKSFILKSHQQLSKNNSIILAMNNLFKRYSTFAVAAYGTDVDAVFAKKELHSSMIEAPFLWTLAVLDILPAKSAELEYERYGFFKLKEREKIVDKKVEIDELFIQKRS
ncbi:hypothetical protein [Thomasclavelia cocleata]|jgi:hypothetical protein|uniref:hypothetical protein n=2 Tax=Thomasclavelia cocleata TaxID=69824 RepID=UPI00241CF940|nr:hypothetical protein [Thomasclavelia cocleata]